MSGPIVYEVLIILTFPIQVTKTTPARPAMIYSLWATDRRKSRAARLNLTSVLRREEPSRAEAKVRNDLPDSFDPVIDHIMGSCAFKIMIWSLLVAVTAVGLSVLGMAGAAGGNVRYQVLLSEGVPVVVAFLPVVAMFAVSLSRDLR